MNEELLAKARAAKSPEELLKIARENGQPEFTMENAKVYFNAINHHGELADEELDVSAGGCAVRSHGQKMVSALNTCKHFRCGACNGNPNNGKLSVYRDESRLGDCNQQRYDPGQHTVMPHTADAATIAPMSAARGGATTQIIITNKF